MKSGKKFLISTFAVLFLLTASFMAMKALASAASADIEGPLPPVILLKGDLSIELNQGDDYVEPGWTALDDVDGNISDLVLVENLPDTDQIGNYTISYSVSNQAGLSKTVTRLVRILPAGEILSLDDGAVPMADGAAILGSSTDAPIVFLTFGILAFGVFIVLIARIFGKLLKRR